MPFEWRAVESFSGDSAVAARAAARTADLVVASEADPDESVRAADLDALLYETGRPVLLVPLSGMKEGPFRKVLVAWNGTREAARAAFDALPFIMEADETTVRHRRRRRRSGEIRQPACRSAVRATARMSRSANSPRTAGRSPT